MLCSVPLKLQSFPLGSDYLQPYCAAYMHLNLTLPALPLKQQKPKVSTVTAWLGPVKIYSLLDHVEMCLSLCCH